MTRRLTYVALAVLLLVATAIRFDGPAEAKGAPNFLQPAGSAPVIETGRVIVQFTEATTPAARANLHAARGGRVVDTIEALSMEVVEIRPGLTTRAAAAAYALSPLVIFAEPNALMPLADDGVAPDDEYYLAQWQHTAIESPEAWATTVGDSDLLVTICDTGVSASHPDLIGNLRGDLGWNTVSNNNDWSPVHFHGTAVAGAAAAVGNNAIGVSGVAQQAGIVPVRVSNRSDGAAEISDIVQCIVYGADIGSTAINLSYTTYTNGGIDTAILDAAKYADAAGSVLVIAAGNSSRDDAPGEDPEYILYVAATAVGDIRASFSNFGKSIDIAAPGQEIVTTYADVVCRGRKCRVAADDYASVSGTSFAAPIVAGAVVVAAAANSALLQGLTDTDRAAELRRLIVDGACDVGVLGEDDFYGAGILNVHASVHNEGCNRTLPPPPEPALLLLQPTLASVYVGDELQFEAIELWDDGSSSIAENVVWTSSAPEAAPIDATTGLVRGLIPDTGFIFISATAGAVDGVGGVSGDALLSVSERPPIGSLSSVASITYQGSGGRNKSKNLDITLSVVDNLGPNPVAGASVDIWLTNGLQLWTGTATTGTDGTVTFTLSSAPSGTYTTIMMGVTAAGLTWDGVTPPNEYTKQ